jgi:hypothetical protein
MEDAFRFALMALFEANEAFCRQDPRWGRKSQYTILEVPALLSLRGFRRRVLKHVTDASIARWFDDYFDALDPRLRLEIINPVQTKVHRYLGSKVARRIVGQPCSTVDFQKFVAEKKMVLVNLNAFDVGEDTAALIGGTLLNLAARAISTQVTLQPDRRQPVTLIVDEFHMIPGADYEQICGELAKYGANLVLATQTLTRLDRLTIAQQTRDLRATIFSNLDGLFAFHTSAEDARYLAAELSGGLDEQDVLELGHYQCYARITDVRTGERLPAFTVQLDPPPQADIGLASQLALESAGGYGRDAIEVDLDREAALVRIDGGRRRPTDAQDSEPGPANASFGPNGMGTPAADRVISGGQLHTGHEQRRRNSKPKPSKRSNAQSSRSIDGTGDAADRENPPEL